MAQTQNGAEFEAACSLLRDECRRGILRILADSSETITRSELARTLARNGYGSGSVRDVAVALHHVHLPMLADENAIRYEAEGDEIAITEQGRRICQFLYAAEWTFTS